MNNAYFRKQLEFSETLYDVLNQEKGFSIDIYAEIWFTCGSEVYGKL